MFAILNLKSNLLPLLRNSEIFDLRTKLQNFPKFQYILTEHDIQPTTSYNFTTISENLTECECDH